MDNEKVLCKIEQMYHNAGWSVYKLSAESGIPQSTLSSIFSHRSNISLSNLDKICASLHISLAEFFTDLEVRENGYRGMEIAEELSQLNHRDKRLLETILTAMRELDLEKEEKRKGDE